MTLSAKQRFFPHSKSIIRWLVCVLSLFRPVPLCYCANIGFTIGCDTFISMISLRLHLRGCCVFTVSHIPLFPRALSLTHTRKHSFSVWNVRSSFILKFERKRKWFESKWTKRMARREETKITIRQRRQCSAGDTVWTRNFHNLSCLSNIFPTVVAAAVMKTEDAYPTHTAQANRPNEMKDRKNSLTHTHSLAPAK